MTSAGGVQDGLQHVIRDGIDITALPKISLHDHLDGAIRPRTVIELAAQRHVELPIADAAALSAWFTSHARGSLEQFLETFAVITPLLQTRDALVRIAREYVLDAAADGILYGEVRWAPEQQVGGGLTLVEACDAVHAGLAEGMSEARSRGVDIDIREIYCAMRQTNSAAEIAELAISRRGLGVVGFDFAGPEDGFPVSRHRRALDLLHEALFPLTIHAGEASGLASIADALAAGQPARIGHGTHLVDDIKKATDGSVMLGRVATWIRDRELTVECCPTSNLVTHSVMRRSVVGHRVPGGQPTLAEHPLALFDELGIRATLNTDDRTQTGVILSDEYAAVKDAFGYGLDDLARFTVNAAQGAFLPFDERQDLLARIKTAWQQAG